MKILLFSDESGRYIIILIIAYTEFLLIDLFPL